jgi:hypothetical protein
MLALRSSRWRGRIAPARRRDSPLPETQCTAGGLPAKVHAHDDKPRRASAVSIQSVEKTEPSRVCAALAPPLALAPSSSLPRQRGVANEDWRGLSPLLHVEAAERAYVVLQYQGLQQSVARKPRPCTGIRGASILYWRPSARVVAIKSATRRTGHDRPLCRHQAAHGRPGSAVSIARLRKNNVCPRSVPRPHHPPLSPRRSERAERAHSRHSATEATP